MGQLLLVDDDPDLILAQTKRVLAASHHRIEVARTGEEGIRRVTERAPDVVLLDLLLPDQSGLEVYQRIRCVDARIPVIFITTAKAADAAIEAMKQGAFDYLIKPLDVDQLRRVVGEALEVARRMHEPAIIAEAAPDPDADGVIVGSCPAMIEVYKAIGRVAAQDVPVLITGESGTGKELVARALHRLSGRAQEPFVAINCAAIPENLLESELFGYEKGAFTGAAQRTLGKLELAGKGTVFLDEMGEMPASLQAKLLRVLQERTVERIGGRTPVPLASRIVCATNRNLAELIAAGKFRDDLFYRISEVTLRIPALRDRQGDSVLLAQWLLQQMAERFGKPVRAFSPEAIRAVQAHKWSGNVRELENCIKGAVIMGEGPVITPADLGMSGQECDAEHLNLRVARQKAEVQAIRQALALAGGNLSRAAEYLGVTRPTLYDLLEKLNIDAAQFARQTAAKTA
jgi:two-component system nitrogen regulation response regulator GlnG